MILSSGAIYLYCTTDRIVGDIWLMIASRECMESLYPRFGGHSSIFSEKLFSTQCFRTLVLFWTKERQKSSYVRRRRFLPLGEFISHFGFWPWPERCAVQLTEVVIILCVRVCLPSERVIFTSKDAWLSRRDVCSAANWKLRQSGGYTLARTILFECTRVCNLLDATTQTLQ